MVPEIPQVVNTCDRVHVPSVSAPPRSRDPEQKPFGIDVSDLELLSKAEYDMLHATYKGPSGVARLRQGFDVSDLEPLS